jgi:hypothetical protein
VANTISEAIEIINQSDTGISGMTHYYYTRNRFEHVKFHGKINWADSSIVIVEDEIILHNFDKPTEDLLLGIIKLRVNKSDNIFFLNGNWQNKKRDLFNSHSIKVKYQKTISDTDIEFGKPDNSKRSKQDN